MYSIVMLAAMTATPATPDFHGLFGGWCHKSSYSYGCTGYTSCNGCTGYSCTGYSCNGCTGYTSCNGCGGGVSQGHSHLFHGGLFHGHKANYSCGGCYGGGCGGCYGGNSCHGVPTYYYQTNYTSCTGCTGYSSTGYSSVVPYTLGGAVAPAGPGFYPAVTGGTTEAAPEAVSSLPTSRAQVVVRVPAGAKLYADGQLTGLTGEERTFLTPELNSDRDYQYTLKIEHEVDGETKVVSKEVVVRGGRRTTVDLSETQATRSTSAVTVSLPENAKLFVDDNLAMSAGGRKTFRTPELTKGATYSYVFRAEVEVDGKVETQSQRVVFKAGEPIRLDFSDMTATRTASAR